jgi:hypothetical protein
VGEDSTARAVLTRRVDLDTADYFIPGWAAAVILELEKMRREMPYADFLELRLVCERRPD